MSRVAAPVADREPVSRELHGETVVDPYAWMRERESQRVLAHLRAENEHTGATLAHLCELQEKVYQEIKSRIQETDLSVPARKGDYWYLTRTEEGQQYPLSCRRSGAIDGPEEVLLDGNLLAGDSEYFAFGLFEVSPDHAIAAYSTDYTGAEEYTLRFRDLASGDDLPDEIPRTYYGGAWSKDARTFFYTRPDDAMRPHQLWRHRMGTDTATDVLVFQEDDERFFLEIDSSRSEDLLFITLQSQTTSEGWFLEATNPEGAFRCIRPREAGVEYWAEHQRGDSGGRLVILATLDAPNGRILEAPVSSPGDWQEMLPHRADVKLDGLEAFADHLVVWCRRDATSGVVVLPRRERPPEELSFDEDVRTVDAGSNLEYDTHSLRFEYESLVTPTSVYDHDLETGERTLLKQQPVLGGYRASDWESVREWATAGDGTRIPISLVHREGTARDSSAPLVLYGYGAYEANSDPWFSAGRLSLLERGVTFAVAHVRGGGELGRHWYEAGKLAHKTNSFDDLNACAEHLVTQGYTSTDRLAARGGSAGGLLVAAAMNRRPDLYRAVVAEVPFVDVVNTMLDESLPLTVTEWEEWGNPRIPEHYEWLRAYAPYENIRACDYPRVFVTAGLNDPRVQYWEPAKWVAALREQTTGREAILLKTEMGAGHGGPSGRYDAWRDEALILTFLLDAFGLATRDAHAAPG
ncbi:MAG: S9 family peptidase [Myxococcota bacterium]